MKDEISILGSFFVLLVLIVFLLGVGVVCNKPEKKFGYVISKDIDTSIVDARNVEPNTYGIIFTVTYQEDKTSIRYVRRVSKPVYDLTIPSTSKLIVFE
jgi:hypothetical protein